MGTLLYSEDTPMDASRQFVGNLFVSISFINAVESLGIYEGSRVLTNG